LLLEFCEKNYIDLWIEGRNDLATSDLLFQMHMNLGFMSPEKSELADLYKKFSRKASKIWISPEKRVMSKRKLYFSNQPISFFNIVYRSRKNDFKN
jgi:hypothetical protein